MKALITGITGQDGSYLAEFLLSKGYEVSGLVRRTSAPNYERIAHLLDQITLIQGDLLDQSSLTHALGKSEPDEIYNLAAMSHVGASFAQPVATGEYNGLGVVRLLEAMRQVCPNARLYQASTSEMFGEQEVPCNEQTRFEPRSPYGISKLYAHISVQNYREAYNIYACSGILFNHESPRRGLDFVTRKITNGVVRIKYDQEEKLVLGNLEASRDWGYAGDYVIAMWKMLQMAEPEDYVIATGKIHSLMDFTAEAFRCAGIDDWLKYIQTDPHLYRPSDIYCLVGDASKARVKLGWEPRIGFEDLVKMMVEAEYV